MGSKKMEDTLLDISERIGARAAGNSPEESDAGAETIQERAINPMSNLFICLELVAN